MTSSGEFLNYQLPATVQSYINLLNWSFIYFFLFLPLQSLLPTKYAYFRLKHLANTQIQIQIQIHKYTNTNTNTRTPGCVTLQRGRLIFHSSHCRTFDWKDKLRFKGMVTLIRIADYEQSYKHFMIRKDRKWLTGGKALPNVVKMCHVS